MIKIIPKQEIKYPKWMNIVLALSFLVLVASFASVLVLRQLQANTIKAIEKIDAQLTEGKTAEESELERRVLLFKDKLDDFARIAEARRHPVSFFELIERLTHQQVFFTSLLLIPKESKVQLLGKAESFQSLAEQILILKGDENIQSVSLASIVLGEGGGVSLGLDIIFQPEFFTTIKE